MFALSSKRIVIPPLTVVMQTFANSSKYHHAAQASETFYFPVKFNRSASSQSDFFVRRLASGGPAGTGDFAGSGLSAPITSRTVIVSLVTFHTSRSLANVSSPSYVLRMAAIDSGAMSKSSKVWYATACRGSTIAKTLPHASGGVWMTVATSRARSGS